MIKMLPESNENAVGIQLSGKLTDKEYKEILIPELESMIKKNGKARLLCYMDENFNGWELEAGWDDAKFGFKHRKDFIKLAVVGGSKWINWGIKLTSHMMSGEIKTFSSNKLKEAWDWVKE